MSSRDDVTQHRDVTAPRRRVKRAKQGQLRRRFSGTGSGLYCCGQKFASKYTLKRHRKDLHKEGGAIRSGRLAQKQDKLLALEEMAKSILNCVKAHKEAMSLSLENQLLKMRLRALGDDPEHPHYLRGLQAQEEAEKEESEKEEAEEEVEEEAVEDEADQQPKSLLRRRARRACRGEDY